MFKVSLDEGYVFDMIAIFEIKSRIFTGQKLEKAIESMSYMCQEVISQIGKDKFDKILSSDEYQKLYLANKKVFALIDLAKTSEGLSKETDDANYDRYLNKISLQKKFFNDIIFEVKNKED
jgi:hypothetical protein